MRLRKIIKYSRLLLCLVFCTSLSIVVFGQEAKADSLCKVRKMRNDSISAVRTNEVNFIVNQIENVYPYGRRGISDSAWNSRVQKLHQKVDSAKSGKEYLFALRYAGALINDSHFAFPDGGIYSRSFIFKKADTIFPVWVRTWNDGSVYVFKDYMNRLPADAQIISINGHNASQIALTSRSLAPKEELNAMVTMNREYESDPRVWCNFTNFLFAEGVKPPYKIEYKLPCSDKIDTVTLPGIPRGERFKTFKHSGDKRAVRRRNGGGFFGKFMEFKNVREGVGVLTIDSFWGKDLLELMIFNTDNKYANRLKNMMARIARHKIDTLIIDISRNGGGMMDNLYKTLNYFTTKAIDANETFYVTDNNRNIMKTVIGNSPYDFFGLSKDQKAELVSLVDSVGDGENFCTDTLFDLQFKPDSVLKHRYTGKVYLVTSNVTYSAAQLFAQTFQNLGIGQVAGQPCGGYRSISGGNAMYVPLPSTGSWFTFMVPYMKMGRKSDADRFEYEKVDIPLEITFDEWLRDENNTVEKLLEIIRNK